MQACYTFSMMIDAWKAILPAELREENPGILLQLLALGDDGISQHDLVARIAISQSGLSRLIAKLRALGLITEQAPSRDRRWRLYRSTAAAVKLLLSLETTMAIFLSS